MHLNKNLNRMQGNTFLSKCLYIFFITKIQFNFQHSFKLKKLQVINPYPMKPEGMGTIVH